MVKNPKNMLTSLAKIRVIESFLKNRIIGMNKHCPINPVERGFGPE